MPRARAGDGAAVARLRLAAITVLVVLVGGTVAFAAIERLGPLDALYTTVGVMSTSGELVHPLSPGGRALAIVVVILGVGTLLYTLGALTEYLVEGHFGRAIVRRRMDRKIERLQGHAIICGYGRVGRRIARELADAREPFVVVDVQESNAAALDASGYLHVRGDASEDAILQEAGILRARTLLAATDTDTENIAITLSARALAPTLWIVARANHDESESKLSRAGADRVLSPYALGGHRMAALASRPHLVDFLDTVMRSGDLELALEEIEIEPNTPLVGAILPAIQADLSPALRDMAVIAIRPAGATHWVAASRYAGTPIAAGDHLVVLGSPARRRTGRAGAASDGSIASDAPADEAREDRRSP
jgi:voltage-gated potassium channel